MKNIYILLIVFGIVVGSFLGFKYVEAKPETKKIESVQESVQVTKPTDKPVVQPDIPVRILIPILGVDTAIESVAKDEKGNMDIPTDYNNTAWYNLGPKPGEPGSAVIDGHVDTPTGAPAVFAYIKNLTPGSQIDIIDKSGKEFHFQVTDVVTYDLASIPLEEIFSIYTPSSLNLITCAGNWDSSSKTYSARTVVYSKLINN